MSAPTVACVMLANGRPEMVARAVKSFWSQTYRGGMILVTYNNLGRQSIGALRNEANGAKEAASAKIIIHWDSDDWSHPNRIAEQVALLQSSGAECAGYGEMLFWADHSTIPDTAQAWLYRSAVPNYAVGTSMCYWRETWERNPFPDRSEGCDDLYWFNRGVKITSIPGFQFMKCDPIEIPPMSGEAREYKQFEPGPVTYRGPLIIASIHGGNTCARIDAAQREWTRAPEWDSYCRSAMRLE